ncbi:hypothetical protein QA641_29350 [Bradyrhizobium sp. CB1650]|uniref:hypothetical protein n=1 Tax=Bradyrhizobium sp. CB1650 TaxID=3039153 RepID=UPI002434A3FD|nr:hypothetical protein [Bradyrhizobium sp. CB1650]WGD56704.1 hypothetical protein QA641_29350 [Bradyrhizobium sp. CB1650]
MMKANGRAALILLAGLFLLFGGAAQAQVAPGSTAASDGASKQTDEVKPTKHRRHTSHRRNSTKTAEKSSDEKDATKAADAKANNNVPAFGQMPPQVANANAQLAAADSPTAAAATAMTNRANDNVQAAADNAPAPGAENQVVAPDQLNEVDRALQQDNSPAQKPVAAATDAQPRPAPVMAASSQQNSAWDQSSLIGKIFIGAGALLTLASAARMFMA